MKPELQACHLVRNVPSAEIKLCAEKWQPVLAISTVSECQLTLMLEISQLNFKWKRQISRFSWFIQMRLDISN